MITELRDDLRRARSLAETGDLAGVLRALDQALSDLSDSRLLTMEEAAEMLGVKSPDALKVLMRVYGVHTEILDGQILAPISEVERIDGSDWVRDLRATDRLHDLADAFGSQRAMTQEEMDALEAGRPGQLPWKTSHAAALDRPA